MNMFYKFVRYVKTYKVNNNTLLSFEKKRLWLALLPSIVFVSLVWLAFISEISGILGPDFSQFGILPRELKGLRGIILSPFIHSSFSHLLSNTLPLILLIWFLFYFYSKIAFPTFIYLWLFSGLLTWLIGRGNYHVGASGIVFALIWFLFFSGIFRRSIQLIAVSLIVAFIYGSTVWSIFPFAELVDSSISWEGHLAGTISGLITAVVLRHQGPQKKEKVWEDEIDKNEEFDLEDTELNN
ncbi:MAG: rhomboid family intramembrane serine protease [Fermentimonas sp.]|jgi:membrane associated rhomboid family serine protease|nr:rhomboid family intramembrane serine protease [Fermentimonas sp.]